MNATYPNLTKLVGTQLKRHPQHKKFLDRRFESAAESELKRCEKLASDILKLVGDELENYCDGYEFICKIQKDEEFYFRRHNRYRLATFQEAYDQVYSNKPFMTSYMHGLLLTQVFWSNHTSAISFYEDVFLRNLKMGARLLEIGPGHGLLMAMACNTLSSKAVTGWDISAASLEDTARSLGALGIQQGFSLASRNLFEVGDERFDAVVFSEVLEHVEQPKEAMLALKRLLAPGGRLFVHVPMNSPAPDHLFLLRSAEEFESFVADSGFRIAEKHYFPATNYSLETAIRHALTISACAVLEAA
jgi:2-polyprenyl-3-methyl-5-hydroxy-6-metoxy-1,4-benzoquinol methylase